MRACEFSLCTMAPPTAWHILYHILWIIVLSGDSVASDHIPLSESLKRSVDSFLKEQDLLFWYQNYSWDADTKNSNFKNIVNLEVEVIDAAKQNTVSCAQIMQIARWGAHPMIDKIQCRELVDVLIYDGDHLAAWVIEDPAEGLRTIRPQVKYVGPTYMTKILRFALPSEFGALDTRITRVFGLGDPAHSYIRLLDLEAYDTGRKWFIKYPQPAWPGEYSKFIFILRYMVQKINRQGVRCPHPQILYDRGIRTPGVWECADVEMALFSFASERIYPRMSVSKGCGGKT